jgi:predicted lipoprotein with Yx(FWY)xxD motif
MSDGAGCSPVTVVGSDQPGSLPVSQGELTALVDVVSVVPDGGVPDDGQSRPYAKARGRWYKGKMTLWTSKARRARHWWAGAWGRLLGVVAVLAFGAGALGLPALAGTATASSTGTVISTANTAYGKALVVGSGKWAGYSLYFITSDHGTTFGCTSTPVKTAIGKLLCTGPSSDKKAEWPAITTTGSPVAGTGVTQSLLGTVERSFGEQITYAGHPLYLFGSQPGKVTGEEWDEPGLPPWHGIWYLMAPTGLALPWAGTLTTMTIEGQTVLAAQMMTQAGSTDFPLYSFSSDTPSHSACGTGACARAWPALLTSGDPTVSAGLSSSKVSTLHSRQGTQVRYDGEPLYFYAFETVKVTSSGSFSPKGSGANLYSYGGLWSLVTP